MSRMYPVETNDQPGDVLAAIDVGTNSVHLVVARVAGPHAFEVLGREKDMVRLGSGGKDMKHLDASAMERATAALVRYRQIADVHGAEAVAAVATSAVREAENRAAFVDRARSDAGIHVEVISGFEEARLIYLGVVQALPVYDQRVVLFDIGGGSTEVLLGQRGESIASRSFKLGAIRLTERFFASSRLHPGAVDSCRRHVRAAVAPFAEHVRRQGFDVAVGSSGTIGSLCAMAAARLDAQPRTYNGFRLHRDELGDVIGALTKAPTSAARAKVAGLEAHRVDIILAGALICEQIFDALELEEIVFSDYALREGVLLDAWRRRHGASLHHLSDLRRHSVLHLASVMDEDPAHTEHVAKLALELFDQTTKQHKLGDDAREYLEAAALLCNVGLFVSHAAHHKHGYYIIRNSEHLTGFTDREIEVIAQIARYHRKSAPKASHAEFAALDEDDKRLVRCCAGLLRVAIGLERSYDARVESVHVVTTKPRLRIEAAARAGSDITLELFSADANKDLLQSALDRPVEIVAGT